MRALIAITLVLAALWSGYWYVGSTAKQEVIENWLAERRSDGWRADYDSFEVVGFPNRFDSRFTNLDLYDPLSELGWKAPIFDILALSYQPNHIIAVFANRQTIDTRFESLSVSSDDMRASVVFEPDTKLAVDRIRLQTHKFSVNSSLGWQMLASSFDLATRQSTNEDFAHDVVLDARRVTPTRAFRDGLDPKGTLPTVIETMFIDMTLGFDAPWDRVAIETGAPEITGIDIKKMNLVWGELGLGAHGKLDVALSGLISGTLTLEIRNWREVLDLFETAGAFDPRTADTIRKALTLMTSVTADPANLQVPLVMENGRMSLGPVPLGGAPRFIR